MANKTAAKTDPAAKGKRLRPISQQQLPEEASRHLRINSRVILSALWESLERRLKADDPKAAELVARMFAYDKAPGGVTIYNQSLQVNPGIAAITGGGKIRSFDQIIGRFEQSDAGGRVISQQDDDVLIPEAEVEDLGPVEDDDLREIEEAAGGIPA